MAAPQLVALLAIAMTLTRCWIAIQAAPTTLESTVLVPTAKTEDSPRPGCFHDGTYYDEGQQVPVKESCLNCTCRQGALRCHLQVCPYVHALYPPPVGCILIERKGACCPKLHCPDKYSENAVARKDPSGRISVWKLRDDVRKRLVKQLSRSATDKQGCVEGGTAYADGSGMMSSSTCEYCFCLKGRQSCVKPRCRTPIGKEGCVPRYRPMICCPVYYDCDAPSTANATSGADDLERAVVRSAPLYRTIDRLIHSPRVGSRSNQRHSLRRRDAGVDTPLAEDVDHQSAASVETSSNEEVEKLDAESATEVAEVLAAEPVIPDDEKETGRGVIDQKFKKKKKPTRDEVALEPVEKLTFVTDEPVKKVDKAPPVSEEAVKKTEKAAAEEPTKKVEKPTVTAEESTKNTDKEPTKKVEKPTVTAEESTKNTEKGAAVTETSTKKIEKNSPVAEETTKKVEKAPSSTEEPTIKSNKTTVTTEEVEKKVDSAAGSVEEKAKPIEKKAAVVLEEPAKTSGKGSDPMQQPAQETEKIKVIVEESEKATEKTTVAAKVTNEADKATSAEFVKEVENTPTEEKVTIDIEEPKKEEQPTEVVKEITEEVEKPIDAVEESKEVTEKVSVNVEEPSKPTDKDAHTEDKVIETPIVAEEVVEEAEKEIEAEAAERAIEVSVTSSVSSVTGDDKTARPGTVSETQSPQVISTQEKRVSSVSVGVSVNEGPVVDDKRIRKPAPPIFDFLPLDNGPQSATVDQDEDYDYQHMELPPSLPNLEIIPFVAADAVVGDPNADEDDDERLNIGLAPQRAPLSDPSPVVDIAVRSKPVTAEPTEPEPVLNLPTTTVSPLVAFRVTFPPRPSSTLPPPLSSSPAPVFLRFPTKRPTTKTPTLAATAARNKFNKPASNNLVGASAFATGGLKVDSCNIYGQVYRVGRIIEELSGPCIECKCTEIGVNCFAIRC